MHTRTFLLALVLAAPMGLAHGAPDPREIDTRVLADGTSNGDYGASGTLDEGGLDVLALDVYEATLPGSTEPAIVLRLIVQGGDSAQEHRIDISLSGQEAHAFEFTTSDLSSYSSQTFAAVRGPFDVGDGHPKAIEGIIPREQLGLGPGDTIDSIVVTSSVGGTDADDMPGSWYFQGVEVPTSPDEDAAPGEYEVQGTAAWFDMQSSVAVIPPSTEPANATITFTSSLAQMEQVLTISATAPTGMEVSLGATTVILAPGASKDVELQMQGIGAGQVRVMASSDLGLSRDVSMPIQADPVVGNGGGVAGPLLATGESFQYRFTTPARFEYHCHPHPIMQGTITIIADDPTDEAKVHLVRIVEGDGTDLATFGFSPASLTVQVNDTVIWVNEGAAQHNVHGTTGLGGDGHDHDHHDHGEPTGEDTPGFGLVLVAAALLVAAIRRR